MTLTGHTALVTGATGFLGGVITRRLAAAGVRVRALARSPQKAAPLDAVPGVEIVMGDIRDREQIRTAARGCDVVIHVAAALDGPADLQHEVNVTGARHVAEAASAAHAARLVHVSSIAVYGFRHAAGSITEEMEPAPANIVYARTKTEGERVVRAAAAQTGLLVSIIRPGMIYGPGARTWTGLVFRLSSWPPGFIGPGKGYAPAIFVDDVADLCILAAHHPAAAGEAFNATPDPAPTWREYIRAYARLREGQHDAWLSISPGAVKLAARVVAQFAQPGTYARQAPLLVDFVQRPVTYRMAKARDLLGWEPQTSLETGIARCAPWLREQGLLKTT